MQHYRSLLVRNDHRTYDKPDHHRCSASSRPAPNCEPWLCCAAYPYDTQHLTTASTSYSITAAASQPCPGSCTTNWNLGDNDQQPVLGSSNAADPGKPGPCVGCTFLASTCRALLPQVDMVEPLQTAPGVCCT
jgi:hypothetical protein